LSAKPGFSKGRKGGEEEGERAPNTAIDAFFDESKIDRRDYDGRA
jgi:hypothetical protein